MPRVSVVVPVYQNEQNLPDLFPELEKSLTGQDFELVFVDDGSSDGSWKVLEDYASRQPRARAVKLSRNFGSFTACLAGLSYATGEAAVIISADLQDPPEIIPQMIAKWNEGNHVVMAVREKREDSLLTRLTSWVYYALMRRFAISSMPRGGFDFVLIDRKVIDVVISVKEKNTTLMGLILWTGFRRASIPYVRRARQKGRSMWTFGKRLKYFIDSFVSFSYFPIRLIQGLGLLSAFVGLAYAALIILLRVLNRIPVEGWSALMVVLLVLGGVQLLMLGVIGEYLWRTLDETKHRPPFVVEKTIGASRQMS